jgi:hypothetical protein
MLDRIWVSVSKILTNVSINLFFRNSNIAKVRESADMQDESICGEAG